MKPIEFMDALSDIKEDYVRQMLDESDAPEASGKVSGAVNTIPITVQTSTGYISDGKKASGSDRVFGGKLRYLALIASAAACIACVAGILRLYQGGSDNSMAADSVFSEIEEVKEVTGTSVSTDNAAETAALTAVYTTAGTTGTVTAQPEDGTKPTTAAARQTEAQTKEATEAAGTKAQQTTAKAAETKTQTSASGRGTTTQKQKLTSTTGKTTTSSRTTTTTTETDEPVTTTTGPVFTTRKRLVTYTQSDMLGDLDLDGDITMIDYFIAARASHTWQEDESWWEIDAAAYDRGNIDRIVGDMDNDSPLSGFDAYVIREIAILRKWGGMPGLKAEEYIRSEDVWNTVYLIDTGDIFYNIYETDENGGYSGDVIVGTVIPKEVRDFYNDACTVEQKYYGWSYDYRFCNWSEAEFNQKMDELREILARN